MESRGTDGISEVVERLFAFDMEAEVKRISDRTLDILRTKLRRRGLVVAVSGGIDSSVCAALAVEAVGKDRVFGLLLPEVDSSPESLSRGRSVVEMLGIDHGVQDIAPTLEAIGCYKWRNEAYRAVFPELDNDWKAKITISGGIQGQFNHFNLVAQDPEGQLHEKRLGLREYLQIVAATNFKQRVRKTLEYFHADRLNYAVVGTPNRLEYDQGFFVKNGDGSADIKPIAHLYKSQVFMLGHHLGLPKEICEATPTTDTYSLPQSQTEFYFALPYREMDVALWHRDHGKPASDLALALGMNQDQAERVLADIDGKRRTTGPLHWPGLLMEPVGGPLPFPGVARTP